MKYLIGLLLLAGASLGLAATAAKPARPTKARKAAAKPAAGTAE